MRIWEPVSLLRELGKKLQVIVSRGQARNLDESRNKPSVLRGRRGEDELAWS